MRLTHCNQFSSDSALSLTDEYLFSISSLNSRSHETIWWNRWKQAHEAGKAPKIFLEATDAKALEYIDMELLKQYAVQEA